MRAPIRSCQSVGTEIPVCFSFPEITAIQPFSIYSVNRLIRKIPYKAACHLITALKDVPIFLEISQTVFHAVCIFTQKYRTSRIFLLFHSHAFRQSHNAFHINILPGCHQFHYFYRVVHGGKEVGAFLPFISFIMHWPGRIQLFTGVVHPPEIFPFSGFISQRPDNNTGMIPVAYDHTLKPFLKDRPEFLSVSGDAAANPMGFKIAFIHYIKPISVT